MQTRKWLEEGFCHVDRYSCLMPVEYIAEEENGKVKDFHRIASGIVKAPAQAEIIKSVLEELTEEEMSVYKHGRNAKSATSAKNSSIIDYRIATGFEALVGYLYLSHKLNRVLELVKLGMERTGLMPLKVQN